MEHIEKEDAAHHSVLRHRAEMQSQDLEHLKATHNQEFEHRRLMLRLERFHELEAARIRKHVAEVITATDDDEAGEGSVGDKLKQVSSVRKCFRDVIPERSLFKQVSEDGGDLPKPMYLRIAWADTDGGGSFNWENRTPVSNARKACLDPLDENRLDKKNNLQERRDESDTEVLYPWLGNISSDDEKGIMKERRDESDGQVPYPWLGNISSEDERGNMKKRRDEQVSYPWLDGADIRDEEGNMESGRRFYPTQCPSSNPP